MPEQPVNPEQTPKNPKAREIIAKAQGVVDSLSSRVNAENLARATAAGGFFMLTACGSPAPQEAIVPTPGFGWDVEAGPTSTPVVSPTPSNEAKQTANRERYLTDVGKQQLQSFDQNYLQKFFSQEFIGGRHRLEWREQRSNKVEPYVKDVHINTGRSSWKVVVKDPKETVDQVSYDLNVDALFNSAQNLSAARMSFYGNPEKILEGLRRDSRGFFEIPQDRLKQYATTKGSFFSDEFASALQQFTFEPTIRDLGTGRAVSGTTARGRVGGTPIELFMTDEGFIELQVGGLVPKIPYNRELSVSSPDQQSLYRP